MRETVQRIIRETAGPSYNWRRGTRVKHPDGHTVEIVGGSYLDPVYGRVSNFFYWQNVNSDGSLGEKIHCGYGW